jgi:hypothetical protein
MDQPVVVWAVFSEKRKRQCFDALVEITRAKLRGDGVMKVAISTYGQTVQTKDPPKRCAVYEKYQRCFDEKKRLRLQPQWECLPQI